MKPDTGSGRPSREEAIEARAAAWIAQRDAGWAAGEEEQFSGWLEADARHAAAVRRLEATWKTLAALRNYRPSARIHPDPDLLRAPSKAPRSPWLPRPVRAALPLAAAIALLLAAWALLPLFHPAGAGKVYQTTPGGFARVTLDDGSVVEINSDTQIEVHYSPDERRIQLRRGEAHFTVAANAARPFWVESKGLGVRAVGTAFDVRLAQNGIEVLVTAGSVKLAALRPERLASSLARLEDSVLTAGWRAVVPAAEEGAARLEKIPSQQVRELLSWQSSRLSFVEMPLGEVIEQFNQRNDVQLRLGDPQLAGLRMGGSFSADNLDSFIRLLTSGGEIEADYSVPQQIVLRKVVPADHGAAAQK
jgi:transmembrane sensor